MLNRRHVLFAATIAAASPTVLFASDHVLTATDAYAAMEQGNLILIDVRRPDEWMATGVADGAWLLNMQDERFGGYLMAVLDRNPDKDIAIICRTGSRTAQLMKVLAENGITRVQDVAEGMLGGPRGTGWIKTGLPVVDAQSAYDAMPKDLTAN
ncbi:MAG: rhodanese-like domain-containing protein [Paracoccaceae bacterium]|jgi:rhodanese-related sulfurtransferase|nr:rhodanese-like domain-containing protein [Paracoccaceae bacterium]MDP7185575.1 rhodanese-like domain-containing protein [Paracoccaceae bacterium]